MNFMKQHRKVTVPTVVLTLWVLAFGGYAVFANTQPRTVDRYYTLPASSDRASQADHTILMALQTESESVETPADPSSSVTHIIVEPEAKDEMLARYEAVQPELANQQLRIKGLELRLAQKAEREALIAQSESISALHEWATTYAAEKWREIEPDLHRDDELGIFADIEAEELWSDIGSRVAQFDPSIRQQAINVLRFAAGEDVAELMTHYMEKAIRQGEDDLLRW